MLRPVPCTKAALCSLRCPVLCLALECTTLTLCGGCFAVPCSAVLLRWGGCVRLQLRQHPSAQARLPPLPCRLPPACSAFTLGSMYIAEVDIVLPGGHSGLIERLRLPAQAWPRLRVAP